MNRNTDIDLGENPMLHEKVEKGNPLKNFLVEYVGSVKQPEDNTVTTEMIVETMAKDFPEFLMVVAEENFMRGYHQALVDVEEGEAAMKQEFKKINSKKTKGKKKSASRRKSKAG